RTSKIKCVFEDGQCTACANAGVACTFANPGSLTTRPPTRKDVEHLQAKIRSLERLITAIDPSFDLSSLPEPPPPHPSNLRFGQVRKCSSAHMRYSLDNHTDRNRQWTSSLPGNIHPVHNSIHTNSSTQKTTLQPITSAIVLSTLFNPTSLQLNTTMDLLPSLSKLEDLSPVDQIIRHEHQRLAYRTLDFYPPPDLQQSLLEIFFREVHSVLRIIHIPSFMEEFKGGRHETDDSFRALCLAMFSLASRFSKDPRVFVDLEGNPKASLQAVGMRYCISACTYLFRPIPTPACLYELQALTLLVIYCLGAASQSLVWCSIGCALQRFQTAEANVEDSSRWTRCRIQDHYRRKTFYILYEFDHTISVALGRPAYMGESDFDVLPPDPEFQRDLDYCASPFAKTSGMENDPTAYEIIQAYNMIKTSLGGLKNLLPVINVINVQRDIYPGANFSSCIKTLIKQLDDSMTTSFHKVAVMFNLHGTNLTHMNDTTLVFSVLLTTWYHEFRLLLHQVFFNSKEKKESDQPMEEDDKKNGRLTTTMLTKSRNLFLDICVESAREIINLLNRLHQRNLLACGFYWIPLRLKNALLVLICALVKQRKLLSEDERKLRCFEISLGIRILNALAPSTYLAEEVSRMMSQLYESAVQQMHKHVNKVASSSNLSPSSSSPTPSIPRGKTPPKSQPRSGPSDEPPSASQAQSTQLPKPWLLAPSSASSATLHDPDDLPPGLQASSQILPASITTPSPALLNPNMSLPHSASFTLKEPDLSLLHLWPEYFPPPASS
ncbi:hypothetical protein VP01_3466g2, partial [Puccinia sorghi]